MNYIEKSFNSYKVIDYDEEKTERYGRQYYKCLCLECNQLFSARYDKIGTKGLVSCKKCAKKVREKNPKVKIEINKQYGDFIVLKDLGYIYPSTHMRYWECQCVHCKTLKNIAQDHLNTCNNTCFCQTSTQGEKKIAELLKNNNINFSQEYIFSDFPKARFDFAVRDYSGEIQFLIEYDGFQHFQETPMCSDSLKDRQEKDLRKNDYCKRNNIPLIRIPYTELNNLTLQDLMLDSKYKI